MKRSILVGVVLASLGIVQGACVGQNEPEESFERAEEPVFAAGNYSVRWADYACRLAQVTAVRFRAHGAEWKKLGVTQSEIDDMARAFDGLASSVTNGQGGLCWTSEGFANFGAHGVQVSPVLSNAWTRTVNGKLGAIAARLAIRRGISSDAANTLLETTIARAIESRADGFPALAYFAPRAQFDAALGTLRMRLSTSARSPAVRSLSFADSVEKACTSKRQTMNDWVNGRHRIAFETKYSDGSSFTQEQNYDAEGRVFWSKTTYDPGHGGTPTTVTLDGFADLSSRSADYARLAEYAGLTAGALGTMAGLGLAMPEPIASKVSAVGLGFVASGFLAEAAFYKVLAAYYGRPAYLPDTLDRSPCVPASDAGTNNDAGPDSGAADSAAPKQTGTASADAGGHIPMICVKEFEPMAHTLECVGYPDLTCYCLDTHGCCYTPFVF